MEASHTRWQLLAAQRIHQRLLATVSLLVVRRHVFHVNVRPIADDVLRCLTATPPPIPILMPSRTAGFAVSYCCLKEWKNIYRTQGDSFF